MDDGLPLPPVLDLLRQAAAAPDEAAAYVLVESALMGAHAGPDPASMGVPAWDRAFETEAMVDPERRASRMLKRKKRLDDDDEEIPTKADDALDLATVERAAALLDALEQVRVQVEVHPTLEARGPWVDARVELERRLTRMCRHDRGLEAAVRGVTERELLGAGERLRTSVGGSAVPAPSPTDRVSLPPLSGRGPYADALDESRRHLDAPLVLEVGDAERTHLATVRAEAENAVAAAVAAVDPSVKAEAVETAHRALAREVFEAQRLLGAPVLTQETLRARRVLLEVAPRSAAVVPVEPSKAPFTLARGVPEAPLLGAPNVEASVVEALRAGDRFEVEPGPPGAAFVALRRAGQAAPMWVPSALVTPAVSRDRGWPGPTGAPPVVPRVLPPRAVRAAPPVQRAPLDVGLLAVHAVDVQLPPDAPAGASRTVERALDALPDVLRSRGAGRTLSDVGPAVDLELVVELPSGVRDPAVRSRLLADQIADALLARGHSKLDVVRLQVRTREVEEAPTPETVLTRLGAGDDEAVARLLAAERRPLDATQRARLADFFGHDFADVAVFAGPMSGALARSLSAEAFTHGRMVFFDPKHYRPDTAQGEALLAHELTHTRQAEGDDRSARSKEAEALATEARYLGWLTPGGAPLALESEDPLAPSRPSAAKADDAAGRGVARAVSGRELEKGDGPRAETADFERRVEQVLDRVQLLLEERGDFESDRVGRLFRSGVRRL
jgi:hypothetical protein